jgi:3-oxoacyl-(acyl-carrier-protein) synthase
MKHDNTKRVVITGVGPVSPVGVGREQFWEAVIVGKSGTGLMTDLPLGFPVEAFRSRVLARIPEHLLPPSDDRLWGGRHFRLGALGFKLAFEDSGLEDVRRSRAAVVLGNAVGGTAALESSFVQMDDGRRLDPARAPSDLMRQMSFHSMAYELATLYKCQGPVLTVSTGCTAGLDAIVTAFDIVRTGGADVAIAGSAEAPLTPVVFAAFDVIGAMTQRNFDAEHASRPFDRDRDGFVLGEGAGFLVLEERGRALRRGAHIYAELTGYSSLSNSYHMTDLPPDGNALAQCIKLALNDSSLIASDIDHVNAHGSSTKQNDICETNAIKSSLGKHAGQITVNSLKSIIGHALGASNAIEMVACALSLDRQHLFPTANLDQPDECCDLDYVAKEGRRASMRHMLKLSNGFSGIHTAVVLSTHV